MAAGSDVVTDAPVSRWCSPACSGCDRCRRHPAGSTLVHLQQHFREAFAFHIEGLVRSGNPVPPLFVLRRFQSLMRFAAT